MAQFTESLSGAEIDTKDTKRITTDEADETLSLSDLPLYSDRCDELWEDFSGGSHSSSSISSSEDDYFEFYSPESRIPIASYPPENIMFFGKLIPYRKPIDSEEGSPSVEEDVKQKKTSIKKNIYRWFFTSNSNSVLSDNEGDQVANKTLSSKRLEKWYYLSQVHKASMLSSSASVKSKWHMLLSGISRVSTEAELRDIKSRQSFNDCSSPYALKFQNQNEKFSGRLWGMMSILSCGSTHISNDIVLTSTK